MKRSSVALFILAALAGATAAEAQAIRENPGFYSRQVPRNDDLSSGIESLGFTINLFGKTRTAAFVNNNGNLTFDDALSTFTPFGLLNTEREIIAPFFADVDTRPEGSKLVTYGQDFVNGHRAFAANYVDVGYYSNHTDKLNSFQVVLIEREDQGPGDFDIEFNYARISWETGDASGGVNGFGGTPATVGWSNGSDTAFQLPGSLISGAFLDGGPYSLVRQSITGAVVNNPGATRNPGRLVFRARDGVINPGLNISGGQFPDAILGVPYFSQLEVGGADPPYTWELQPDIVAPPGLGLTAAGALSGTPTAAGTYSFTIGVTGNTEDGRITAYQRGSVTIRPPALRITSTCPMPDATVGMPFSRSLTATGSANGYRWSIAPSQIPAGLGLTPSGTLAGTPLAPGTHLMNLTVNSGAEDFAQPAQLLCRLNVNPAATRLVGGCELPRGTVGIPLSIALWAEGGAGFHNYELAGGHLPINTALGSNGVIAGTPGFWGLYFFKVATLDAQNKRVEHDCSWVVDPRPFEVTGACPMPNGTTGVPYTAQLPSGFVWSKVGSLPPGLTLNPSGGVGGTPIQAGPHQFTLIATNSQGQQSSQACSLAVERGSLSVQGCPAPNARAGVPYAARLSGIGGSGPYSITAQGQLPANLRLSSSGELTGTPTQAGVYPFSVLVRDDESNSTVQACQITVEPASLRMSNSCPLPDAMVGKSYAARLEASGGQAPYAFFLNGYLPAGLELAQDGAINGIPTAVGGGTFSIRLLDSTGALTNSVCSVAVVVPAVPAISLGVIPATVAPAATNLAIPVRMAEPFSAPVTGRVTLRITPDTTSAAAVANAPDPRLGFASGQTSAVFTIPAGATGVSIPVASSGTVASTVEVRVSDLRSSGVAIDQAPALKIFRVPQQVPSVSSVCFARNAQGMTLQLTGISTTRELSHAVITIPVLASADTAGLQRIAPEFFISDNGNLRVDLKGVAEGYFGNALTVRSGGAFTLSVNVPLDLSGLAKNDEERADPTLIDIGTVEANIFNSVGAAGNRTVPSCP